MKHEIIKAPMRDIIIPVPENTKDCITLIKSDCYRRMGGGVNLLLLKYGRSYFDWMFWPGFVYVK